MPLYELTYLISPKLGGREAEDFQKKIEALISKRARILKSEKPKKINLAYPIQKEKGAFLAVLEFNAQPPEAENLKKEIATEKNILRFLLIKKKELQNIEEIKRIKTKKPTPSEKVGLKEINGELEKILEK